MKKKVTMVDIAREANVSQTTVSLVLNQTKSLKISDETRRNVIQTAERLGYNKRLLAPQGDKKIAIIVDSLSEHDPFVGALRSAWQTSREQGYLTSTFYFDNDQAYLNQIIDEIKSNNYVGVIYASSVTRKDVDVQLSLNLPILLINCIDPNQATLPSILPADMHGGYLATEHLIQQGAKNIAIVLGESWMNCSSQRQQGYQQALIDNDLIPKQKLTVTGNWSLQKAYLETLQLLKDSPEVDAIFCCSDYMAIGCYQAINEIGRKIGQDIAVIGYDNAHFATELMPKLSSIEIPYAIMGEEAVMRLHDMISGEKLMQMNKNISGELFVRKSTTLRNDW